jgi:hypothetical protein
LALYALACGTIAVGVGRAVQLLTDSDFWGVAAALTASVIFGWLSNRWIDLIE